jgi:alkylated DNA repair dioxygenase AlkB
MKINSIRPEGSHWAETVLPPDGCMAYCKDFLDSVAADRLFARLREEADWEQREIMMFGRSVLQPRLTAFHGDSGLAYRYSGKTLVAAAWTPALAELRDRLAERLGLCFNSVLCNLYRDGQDSMGWHSDNEPELGPRPAIASISLGGERCFQLKPRAETRKRTEIRLAHGSLLLMAGDMQRHWLHQLPKTRLGVDPRINLTFRTIFSPGHS